MFLITIVMMFSLFFPPCPLSLNVCVCREKWVAQDRKEARATKEMWWVWRRLLKGFGETYNNCPLKLLPGLLAISLRLDYWDFFKRLEDQELGTRNRELSVTVSLTFSFNRVPQDQPGSRVLLGIQDLLWVLLHPNTFCWNNMNLRSLVEGGGEAFLLLYFR